MSALYQMTYTGQAGWGGGAVYVGKGKVVGVDVGGIRYKGDYCQDGDRLKLNATMSRPAGSGQLVTGMPLPAGIELPISADWPVDFANGSPQTILVQGRPVQVKFEKIGDVP